MNKASGADGILVQLFKILEDYTVKVLHSICQQIWKIHQWPQDWKMSVFIPIPKGNAKECSSYHIVVCISHATKFSSVQSLSSVHDSESCPTLYDPMDYNTSGFPVHHQLLELVQTHVHQVSDAIQPSTPLSSPSPPIFNIFQHQGLFQ